MVEFQLSPAALAKAADALDTILAAARNATIRDLPESVGEFGSACLSAVAADFCARWDAGLAHLLGDSEAMAWELNPCAEAYLQADHAAAMAHNAARAASRAPTSDVAALTAVPPRPMLSFEPGRS